MITVTEEPYESPVAVALVQELLVDLNERYADIDDDDHYYLDSPQSVCFAKERASG